MLEVSALSCDRDRRRLFSDLTFSLSEGHLLQVVGGNGSGKSTLLRTLLGLYTGFSGQIEWSLDEAPLYLAHKPGVKNSLTVGENLRWSCSLRDRSINDTEMDETLTALKLIGYQHTLCGHLSEGQRKRVSLGQFLLCENRCWVMDEPFSAIDSQGLDFLNTLLQQHLDGGGAVILSSHQAVQIDHPVTTLALDS
jgi:heme exporter protein A